MSAALRFELRRCKAADFPLVLIRYGAHVPASGVRTYPWRYRRHGGEISRAETCDCADSSLHPYRTQSKLRFSFILNFRDFCEICPSLPSAAWLICSFISWRESNTTCPWFTCRCGVVFLLSHFFFRTDDRRLSSARSAWSAVINVKK